MTAESEKSAPVMELDEFGAQAVKRYVDSVNNYNALVSQIKAASGTPEDVLAGVMSDTSDPTIEKYLSAIERHKAGIQKLEHELTAYAQPIADERVKAGSSNVEAEIAQADVLHKTVKSGRTYLIDSYGEEVLEGTPDVARRTNRSAGGGGGKRIRGFDVHVDGQLATMRDQQGVERSNFAAAGKAAGVVTADLQKAFYVAAGSEKREEWPDRVEFSVTDKEGNEHAIVALRLTEDETPEKE